MQQLIVFPLEVCSRFLPVSGLAIYYFVKRKYEKFKFGWNPILTLSGIVLFNFVSYWLAPHTSIRYLLPLYPFIALLLAIVLWNLSKSKLKIIIIWVALTILVKYVELAVIYYYQIYYRRDYTQIAKQVIMQTKKISYLFK